MPERSGKVPLIAAALALFWLAPGITLADLPPKATVPGSAEETIDEPSQVFVKDTHATPELVVFAGNLVFNDFTYRAVLQLPKNATPSNKTARMVVLQLTRFLKKAGYELASVKAVADVDTIQVTIDEGHLDRVVITGESAVNTIRLRLELQQPFDVFNRPELEERLRALSKRMGLTDASYQLVKTKDKVANGVAILEDSEAIAELRDAGLLSEPGVYELHISIRQSTWGKGFSPEVVIGGLDGVGLGGVFHGSRLLPMDDRYETRLRLGVTTLPTLDGQGSQLVLSRALAEIHYWSAPLLGQNFRPGFLLSSDLLEQSRRDILYDLFRRETLQGVVGVGDTITPHLFLAAGVGAQARWFIDLDDPTQTGTPLQPTIPRQIRPVVLSTLRFTIDPGELRHDFRSPASITAQVFRDDNQVSYRLDAGIDYAAAIGWHELRWDVHSFAIGGDTQFFDEESLGDYMQNAFNDIFSKHIVEAGAEFRYSLLRDQLKIGLLGHILCYGQLPTVPGVLTEQGAIAGSLGVGLHTLVWDAINIDADISFGLRSGATGGPANSSLTSTAFSLNLTQVY